MTDETIRHLMADLKLRGMLAEYESWASDGMAQMTFHEKLGLLLQAQHDLKRDNKVRAMHNKAKLAQPDAYTEEIIYDADRGLDRDLIVELAGCSFVADSDNVLVLGQRQRFGAGRIRLREKLCRVRPWQCRLQAWHQYTLYQIERLVRRT